MSIQHRRPAAGQWTAAYLREDKLVLGYRRKRLASWLVIIPTLAVFSLSIVAGAQALRKPDYAQAAKKLPANQPLIVVAGSSKSVDNFWGWLESKFASKELCSVTQSQLTAISTHYRVGHMTINVDGKAVDLVTVDGPAANDREMREYLGDPNLKCTLVRRASTFYLPFDAHTS